MHIINITVRDKIATHVGDAYYVCGNSDFVVHFDFDEEWDALDVKTARFIRQDGAYHDQVFSGSECPVPIISNTNDVRVGVFAGNLCTTTPARVPAVKSILCPGGVPAAPGDDVYNQIMQEVNETRGAAEENAKGLEAARGEIPDVLIVKLGSGNVSSHSQQEVKDAYFKGKTGKAVLMVDMMGRVFSMTGVKDGVPIFHHTSATKLPADAPRANALLVYEAKLNADGTFSVGSPNYSTTPNPYKLTIKQGDKSMAYDGSSAVVVEIPQGGGSIADPGEAHQMLVSDAEGKADWQPLLAYKYSAEGALLAETTIAADASNPGEYLIRTPWAHAPAAGSVCSVTYNGTAYQCTAVDGSAFMGIAGVVVFGNLSNVGLEGGNDDAPFLLASYAEVEAAQAQGVYGLVVSMGETNPDAVTVSVAGPRVGVKQIDREYVPDMVCKVQVPLSYDEAGKPVFGAAGKSWAQVEAAYNAGLTIRVVAKSDNGTHYGDVRCAFVTEEAGLVLAFEIYLNGYLNNDGTAGRCVRQMHGNTDGTIVFEQMD